MSNKVKIKAENIALIESELYTVAGEDEILYVCDVEIAAYIDGKKFVLKNYLQCGATYVEFDPRADGGGFYVVNRGAKAAAARFAERIVRRGEIDLSRWEEVEEVPLEERLAFYAQEEAQERAGYGGWGLGW
jgi:hypothetical protein